MFGWMKRLTEKQIAYPEDIVLKAIKELHQYAEANMYLKDKIKYLENKINKLEHKEYHIRCFF